MSDRISPEALNGLLGGNTQFALIDVREDGEFHFTHIPGASLVSRRQLEFLMPLVVPFNGARVVLCDDDGRRADLAAATLERMGYQRVSVLDGGINRWAVQGYHTEWGSGVPGRDYGERVLAEHNIPEIGAVQLHEQMEQGVKLLILDTRTPEEYQRSAIPGARSVPGGELALRIADITKDLDEDTTVVVNCGGRTRGILGARLLQQFGISNVVELTNGTGGWRLAGYQPETGADRVGLPDPSTEGLAAAEAYASRVGAEDGVRYLDLPGLQSAMERRDRETIYLIDVRTREEHEEGHIPGFVWFPGGQAVIEPDDSAAVKNSTIVFACDRKVRSTVTASWYRRMGFQEVFAVDGGTTAWAAAGLGFETGLSPLPPVGLSEARDTARMVSAEELYSSPPPVVIFVDSSQSFAAGHVPGAHWVPRGWLESQIADVAPDKNVPIAVTCSDGVGWGYWRHFDYAPVGSTLAGATLVELGYKEVSVLEGGMSPWRQAGYPVERGLTGVMNPPSDVMSTKASNFAESINTTRWQVALGTKYATRAD